MDKKLETALFYVFFATMMAPLTLEVLPHVRIYLCDFPLFALCLCFFMRLCMRNARLRFDGFDVLYGLFFAWLGLCSWQGHDFDNSSEWLLFWLRGYFIIFYMRHNLGAFISSKTLFYAVGLCLLLEPALAVLQTVTQSSIGVVQQYFGVLKTRESGWLYEGSRVTRAQGTLMHTNFFGNWLVMLMPFLQARITLATFKQRRNFGLWWGFCLLALVLTFSRANWMAFLLGFLAVLLAERRYRSLWSKQRRWISYLVVPLVLLIAAYAVLPEETEFLIELAFARAERTFDDKSSSIRTDLIAGAFTVLEDNYLFGVGPGNSKIMIQESNPFIPTWFRATVHNIYLIIATEAGIIGLAFFLMIMHWPLVRVLRLLRHGSAILPKDLLDNAVGMVGALVGLLFAMLWYVGMLSESEFPLIATLIGAALGMSAAAARQIAATRAKPLQTNTHLPAPFSATKNGALAISNGSTVALSE
jgi:O-antigen ligase